MLRRRQSLVFESASDEPFRVMVEPEAFEWDLHRGDRFEISWVTRSPEPASVVWHGRDCVAVYPPDRYKVVLNGRDAFEQLEPNATPTV